ncbi:integrin alpha-M-like [Denticeps clupeoides]|uniref:VWFA domain-containing protein n=1 Tax=Denticeps clupeoides TaxID=299321 RepID=A0AAY4C5R7_9TELE|nr:integrin alpha-M-like [Denticeps clupeoides]
MGWISLVLFYWFSASHAADAFNLDPVGWKSIKNTASWFGYRVIQKDSTSLFVSAPLEQYASDKRGRVFECQVMSGSCTSLPIPVPSSAINMSLGLSMSKDQTSKMVVCGPTITKDCDDITLYGGMCFSVNQNLVTSNPVPPFLEDCPGTDIAFLLDGSGSIHGYEFIDMKNFVKNLIRNLLKQDIRFAVAQYSRFCNIHIRFNQFERNYWENQINQIGQIGGGTNTAGAINMLVNQLFTPEAGARETAKKILIVITDGESQDGYALPDAIAQADRKKIVRYAIGVGSAFSKQSAKLELSKIASSNQNLFRVDSFAALENIRNTLTKNIIAIEGTQTSGDATNMEFAQKGFSAVFISNPLEKFVMSAVGAYGWKGGYHEYYADGREMSSLKDEEMEPDSYLGYSMAVATIDRKPYVIVGAPRYKHWGLVRVFSNDGKAKQTLQQNTKQIGSYFGADVCVLDLDGDSNSDLILVSAPMYREGDQEGKVFIFKFSREYFYSVVSYAGETLMGAAGQRGRFGSSLASLADLNGDGILDVAVGAPLEDNNQGSVYIFNGRRNGVNPTYSQRILGSSVQSGLKFFGLTLSSFALDQSGDGLPDIAVGSKGAVLVLRSRPVVSITTTSSFTPSKIPSTISDCTQPQRISMKVCFLMKRETRDTQDLQAKLTYNMTLDSSRQTYRAFFTAKNRMKVAVIDLKLKENCQNHDIFVECSPEDALNPLINNVKFKFEGNPLPGPGSLRPIMSNNSNPNTNHLLDFEFDCGQDKVCVDNLKVDFNFSGSTVVEVGIAQEMRLTVMVENRGENSYNTHVKLSYPPGLSYRAFTMNQGRVECGSLDSEDEVSPGLTTCNIYRPILKANTKAIFMIHYGIEGSSQFTKTLNFTANVLSGNDQHSPDTEASQTKTIGVKYGIYILIKRFEETTNYVNFTAKEGDVVKPVRQVFQVVNYIRGLNATVVLHVPVKLGAKDIWADPKPFEVPGCRVKNDVQPNITDFKEKLKDHIVVDCSIALCRVFHCDSYLMKERSMFYNISGNISFGWIEQTGLKSAKFELVSEATLKYDKKTYIFTSSDIPVTRVMTIVEVYDEPSYMKQIIGGVVGGLLLLALITAVLYKTGFFKSQYKQMLESAGQETATEGEEALS